MSEHHISELDRINEKLEEDWNKEEEEEGDVRILNASDIKNRNEGITKEGKDHLKL